MWNLEGVKTYMTARGYVLAYLPEHPAARNGSVLLHRVMMENALGRLLRAGEVVHHKDRDKSNNEISNLQLMTPSQHAQEHVADRPASVERTQVCPACASTFIPTKRPVQKFCSRSCSAKINSRREIPHGKYGRYRKGCRCTRCREANAERCRR